MVCAAENANKDHTHSYIEEAARIRTFVPAALRSM